MTTQRKERTPGKRLIARPTKVFASTLKPVEQGANHSICLEVGKFSPNNEAVALAFQIHDDAKVLHSLGNYKDWKGVRVQIAKMRGAIDYCEILMGNKGKK